MEPSRHRSGKSQPWIERTIGRKLLLFTAPLAIVALAAAAFLILANLRIGRELDDITDRAYPLSAAAYELEINVNGMALGVAKYLQRADPSFRQRFLKDADDFRRSHRDYMRVATTPTTRQLGVRAGQIHDQFLATGAALLTLRDRKQARLEDVAKAVSESKSVIGPGTDPRQWGTPGSVQAIQPGPANAELGIHAAAAALWLTVSLGSADGQALERSRHEIEQLRADLDRLSQLSTDASPNDPKARYARTARAILDAMGPVIDFDQQLQARLAEFVALHRALDYILDDRIQVLVRDELDAAHGRAAAATWTAQVTLGVAMGILAALTLVAFHVSRKWIFDRFAALSRGVRHVAAGNLDSRIRLGGTDELAELGSAINGMLDKLSHAQDSLANQNQRLEEIVAERTANVGVLNRQLEDELAHRQTIEAALQQAKNAAEAASRAKSEFLANMSHELRTPLNAIIGFSEMMRLEALGPIGGPRYRAYAGDIFDSGEHLLRIINDILDLAKIEAGKVTLDETRIDCRKLGEECIRFFSTGVADRPIDLSVDDRTGPLMIRGDETKLKRALINLLSNALKFTRDAGKVAMTIMRAESGGVSIAVTDDGVGIPPDKIETALAPFGQVAPPADAKVARAHEGSGLGLPLTRSLIELHGGTLALESTVGEGTTVTLTLPPTRLAALMNSWPAAAGGGSTLGR